MISIAVTHEVASASPSAYCDLASYIDIHELVMLDPVVDSVYIDSDESQQRNESGRFATNLTIVLSAVMDVDVNASNCQSSISEGLQFVNANKSDWMFCFLGSYKLNLRI